MRILKGAVKNVDSKEFKNVMDGYEGYEHYKVDETTYVRFNSTAFLSNYKRNDLLSSHLQLYCIGVGSFSKDDFNFIIQLNKMAKLSEGASAQTLADVYPSTKNETQEQNLVVLVERTLHISNYLMWFTLAYLMKGTRMRKFKVIIEQKILSRKNKRHR